MTKPPALPPPRVVARAITVWRLRRFIAQNVVDEPLGSGDPLAEGLLDSLAIEQLIAYIQEQFGVSFDDQELVAENFSSVPTLAVLVDTKRRCERRRRRVRSREEPS